MSNQSKLMREILQVALRTYILINTGNCLFVRNLEGEKTDIDRSLESLRDYGFINYFGLQRFGTTSVPTHHVGR